jgi:hypothetical protein
MDLQLRPDVLIAGGFLTEPFQYAPLRDRLLARGARSVRIAPVHVIDWLGSGLAGLGPLLVRTGLAVRRTHRAAGGRPVLVLAHSGGGILAGWPFRRCRSMAARRMSAMPSQRS